MTGLQSGRCRHLLWNLIPSLRQSTVILALAGTVVATPVIGGPPGPSMITSDVDRFYSIYDGANGHPSATELQQRYIDAGSSGMRDFVRVRGLTGSGLAAAIEKDARPFEDARRCVASLPRVRPRLASAFRRLKALYPDATFPPTTILIGRVKTAGTTSRSGVLIGMETLCGVPFLEPNLEDRLVHLISHEYAHVQQPHSDLTDAPGNTVLFTSLIEGGAELVAELTSGGVSYPHLRVWANGREGDILRRFVAERESTDLSAWVYNGAGSTDRPGDLGYWAGYRVTKAYYERATDKRKALKDILQVTPATAEQILRGSGLLVST